MKLNRFLALIAIIGCTLAHADSAIENEIIINQALAAFDDDYKTSWAFTRTSIKGDKPAKVGYFDPRQPAAKQWTLLSIGDDAPTTKEQEAWASRRIKEDEDNKNGIAKMITPDSAYLLEENATHWLFSFTPAADEFEDKKTRKLMSQVAGKLRVNKAGLYIDEILLSSDESFRPAFGIKIQQFEMRMTFGPDSQSGLVLPLGVDTHIQGRAFLAVSFDDVKKVRFSDYRKVVAEGNQNQIEVID